MIDIDGRHREGGVGGGGGSGDGGGVFVVQGYPGVGTAAARKQLTDSRRRRQAEGVRGRKERKGSQEGTVRGAHLGGGGAHGGGDGGEGAGGQGHPAPQVQVALPRRGVAGPGGIVQPCPPGAAQEWAGDWAVTEVHRSSRWSSQVQQKLLERKCVSSCGGMGRQS